MTAVTGHISASLDGFAAGPNQSEELLFGGGVDDRLRLGVRPDDALAIAASCLGRPFQDLVDSADRFG